MALQLALSNSIINYTSLNFTDASGEYSITNTTGWGAPNLAISAVLYAHLIITNRAGTEYDVDIIDDLGINYATASYSDLVYNIPSTFLGGTTGDLIPDDVYTVEYRISDSATWDDGGNDYSVTATIMTYYVIQQSVYNRIKLLPNYYTCSSCDNMFVKETHVIFMLLQALIASTQYSNSVRFIELLSALTDILAFDTENCSSCGC